jgi:hypothetical protein
MADADDDGKALIGHAHETNVLSYGHYGTASFEGDAWRFLRDDASTIHHELAGKKLGTSGLEVVNDRVLKSASDSFDSRTTSHFTATKSTTRALRVFPELGFVTDYLTSEPLTSSTRSHDNSTASNIIACAFIPAPPYHRSLRETPTVPILVKSSSSDIEYCALHPGLEDEWSREEVKVWRTQRLESAEPVLQLVFSERRNVGEFLGVRKRSSITLLRPVYAEHSQRTHTGPAEEGASTGYRVRWEHVATLPVSHTGGHHLSNVHFDPRNERRFAVVDTHGHWSIWEIAGRPPRSARVLWRVSLAGSAKFKASTSAGSRGGDGWFQLCWLNHRHEDRLLVCKRRSAQLFDTTGELVEHVDARLYSGTGMRRGVVLDVRPLTGRGDMCVVLTSGMVLLMKLRAEEETGGKDGAVEMVCSWVHFRGANDHNLQVRVVDVSERPRRTVGKKKINQKKRKRKALGRDTEDEGEEGADEEMVDGVDAEVAWNSDNEAEHNLDTEAEQNSDTEAERPPDDEAEQPSDNEAEQQPDNEPANDSENGAPKKLVYQLVVFSRENSRIDVFPVTMSKSDATDVVKASDRATLPISDELRGKMKEMQLRDIVLLDVKAGPSEVTNEDFGLFEITTEDFSRSPRLFKLVALFEDETAAEVTYRYLEGNAVLEDETKVPWSTDIAVRPKHKPKSSALIEDEDDEFGEALVEDFIVEDGDLVDELREMWASRRVNNLVVGRRKSYASWPDLLLSNPLGQERDITEKLDRLRTRFARHSSALNYGTTLDQMIDNFNVEDIEEASEAITDFTTGSQSDNIRIGSVRQGLIPLTIYNTLVQTYVTSLGPDVPDRLRVITERSARSVAVETFLADQVLRPGPQHDRDSQLGSNTGGPSSQSTDPLSILSKYTPVTKPKTVPSSRSAQEILAHLPVELTDTTYSWQDTELNVARARAEFERDSDPNMIRQRDKQAAKRKMREEAERRKEEMRAQTQSQTVPEKLGSSQSTQLVAQSQPERGIRGIIPQRPAKRRVKGF